MMLVKRKAGGRAVPHEHCDHAHAELTPGLVVCCRCGEVRQVGGQHRGRVLGTLVPPPPHDPLTEA